MNTVTRKPKSLRGLLSAGLLILLGTTIVAPIIAHPLDDSLFINVDSNVGVGTNSPTSSLHIRRTDGSAHLLVEEGAATITNRTLLSLKNNGPVSFAFEDSGTKWTFVGRSNAFRINLAGTGVNELNLDSSGNLTVEGDIISNGTTFIPDYVFEPDYPLMPLDELATFVAERKHLPNLPSQRDVNEQRGVNLSQLQLGLLEKLEELTLYTLAQHEVLANHENTILEQQETIEELRERLAALEEAGAREAHGAL